MEKKNPYMPKRLHIRKSTISELNEFLALAHICFSARHRGSFDCSILGARLARITAFLM